MALLTAPTYFKLKETKKGTVLVTSGVLVKEDESKKYAGVRQFYFQDSDGKLKCLTGGSLAYVIDLHDIDKNKVVKITYGGSEVLENGKFAGNAAHQFEVELLEDNTPVAPSVNEVNSGDLE